MGRRRIATEAEANRVMDRLEARGEPISVRTVRAELGGGSSQTVAAYVRAWRRRKDRKSAAAVHAPGAVGARLAETSSALWAALEQAHRDECAEWQEELERQLEAARAQIDALRLQIETLTRKGIVLEAENRVLREQLKGSTE